MDFLTGLLADLRGRGGEKPRPQEDRTAALPPEMIDRIFRPLELKDLARAGRVSRHWHDLSQYRVDRMKGSSGYIHIVAAHRLSKMPPRERWHQKPAHTEQITSALLTDKYVIGIGSEKQLKVLDVESGKPPEGVEIEGNDIPLSNLTLKDGVWSAIASDTQEKVQARLVDSKIFVERNERALTSPGYQVAWKVQSDPKEAHLVLTPAIGDCKTLYTVKAVDALKWWHIAENHLFARLGNTLFAWDLKTGAKQELMEKDPKLQVHLVEDKLWTVSANGLQTWDLKTLEPKTLDENAKRFYTGASSKGMSIGYDNHIQVWDLAIEKAEHKWDSGNSPFTVGAFLGDEALVTGATNGEITFWKLDGTLIHSFNPFNQEVGTLRVSDGRLYAASYQHRALFDLISPALRSEIVENNTVARNPVVV